MEERSKGKEKTEQEEGGKEIKREMERCKNVTEEEDERKATKKNNTKITTAGNTHRHGIS